MSTRRWLVDIDNSPQKLCGSEVGVAKMEGDIHALLLDATGQEFVNAFGKIYPLRIVAVVGEPLPARAGEQWFGTLFIVSLGPEGALELGEALQRCSAQPIGPGKDPPEACATGPGLVCADMRNIAAAIRSFCRSTGSPIPAFSSRDPLARMVLEYGNEYALSVISRRYLYVVTEDFRGLNLEDAEKDVQLRLRPFVRASPWPFITIEEWCAYIEGYVSTVGLPSSARES
jgi:hypothetical protein